MKPTPSLLVPAPASAVHRSGFGRALADEIMDRWQQGEAPDARAALSCYPELKGQKSVLIDLAYEEFCLRKEAGESVDPDDFCDQFPRYQASLRKLLAAHQLIGEDTDKAARGEKWPHIETDFLGCFLQRELGRGAFARVYLATEGALGNRRVAVKVSRQGRAEAHTLGRINHPNIVPVHWVREESSSGLIVVCMPYLGSATLCDVLDRVFADNRLPASAKEILSAISETVPPGEMPPERGPDAPSLAFGTYIDGVIQIGAQLAEALNCIHTRGICHRDLKPSNVLMSPDGRPMLLDFNLSADDRLPDNPLGGTLPYMSPEQLLGTALDGPRDSALIDARSDLFSLGVLLYELLTGKHPFGPVPLKEPVAKLRQLLLERQRNGIQPVRALNRQVDPGLAHLVEQCLAYNPKERPNSAAALALALRKRLAPLPRARRWAKAHPYRVLCSMLFTVVVGAAGAAVPLSQAPYSVREMEEGKQAYQQRQFAEALTHYTSAMNADPNLNAHFVKGRALQQLGRFTEAFYEYRAADQLKPDPETKACMGYCMSQEGMHEAAIGHDKQAIEGGFGTAEVYNNRAFSLVQYQPRLHLAEADECLLRAAQQDPNLQAIYFNRVMLELKKASLDQNYLPLSGPASIRKAVELGPPSAELFVNSARLYGLIGTREPLRQSLLVSTLAASASPQVSLATLGACPDAPWLQPGLNYLQRALQLGFDPRTLVSDPTLQVFKDDATFKALLSRDVPQASASPNLRLVDPVKDLAN
jgi:tetratricopeptide (TPR) repeat protein